jgi:hypothetical protein
MAKMKKMESMEHGIKHAGMGQDKKAYMGVKQGDMSAHVDEIGKPANDFSQEGFSKTLEYVERQNAFQAREASDIKKQSYQGRYS